MIATFRDAGQADALQLAAEYAARSAAELANAKAAARQLFGIHL